MANEQKGSKKTYHMLRSRLAEGITSYSLYDAATRVQTFYEGPISVVVGEPCLITEFKYIDGAGGTSRVVLATREEAGVWPAIDFDALP